MLDFVIYTGFCYLYGIIYPNLCGLKSDMFFISCYFVRILWLWRKIDVMFFIVIYLLFFDLSHFLHGFNFMSIFWLCVPIYACFVVLDVMCWCMVG